MVKESTVIRDQELRDRFNSLMNSGINRQYYNWNYVVKLLARQPAPCFYITPKMAEQYVLGYYRGEQKLLKPIKREMVKDLVENYERIVSQGNHKYSYEIWDILVECPAKSFYLKERTIRNIIYEYIRPSANRKRNRKTQG